MASQRVGMAEGLLAGSSPWLCPLQQVNADEDVLGQPADEEDKDHG